MENKKQELLLELKFNENIDLSKLGRTSQTQKHSNNSPMVQQTITSPKVHLYYMTADNKELALEGYFLFS